MPHPTLGSNYHGFRMNGRGSPSPRWPRFGNGGGNLAAGLGAALEDREQDAPALEGTELASGRKTKDDAEVKGGKGNTDTLDSDATFAGGGSSEPIQLASGWGPDRPTAKTRQRAVEPFGVTYGPVYAHRLKDADARRVWDMKYVPTGDERGRGPSSFFEYAAGFAPRWSSSMFCVPDVFALDEHRLIVSLLGDVKLYVMSPAPGRDGPTLVAAHAGRVYDFDYQLAALLHDCGVRFAQQDVGDWMRLLSLVRKWRDFQSNDGLMMLYEQDAGLGSAQVIPALRFDSVRIVETPRGPEAQLFLESGGDHRMEEFPVWSDTNAEGDSVYYPNTGNGLPEEGSLDDGPAIQIVGGAGE